MLARSLYRPLSRSVALSPYSLTSLSRSPLALAPLRTMSTKSKDWKGKKEGKSDVKASEKSSKEVEKKGLKGSAKEEKEDKVEKKHNKAEEKHEKADKAEKKDGKEKKEDKVEKKEDKVEKKETKTDIPKVEKKAEKESTKEKDARVEKKEEKKEEKKIEKKEEKEEKEEKEKKMEKKEEKEKEPKVVVKVKEETVVVEKGKAPVHESVSSKATLKIDKDGNPKLKLKEKVEVDGEVVEKQKVTIKGQDNNESKKDKKKKDKMKKKNEDEKEKKEPKGQPISTMPLDDFYIVDSSIAIPVLNLISPPSPSSENTDKSAATLISNPPEFDEWVNKLKESGGKLYILPSTRARITTDGELPLPLVELKKVPTPEKESVIAMLDRALAHLKGSRGKVDTSAAELLTAGWSLAHVDMKGKEKGKAPVFLTGNMKLWKYVLTQGKEKLTNILNKHKLGPLIATRTIAQKSTWKDITTK